MLPSLITYLLGMNVTRDRGKGTITISQIACTDDVVQRYCMKGCNLTYNPGVGPGLSLNQPEEKLLNEEEKRRYQSITGAVMYLAQVTRYDILYAVNHDILFLSSSKSLLNKLKKKLMNRFEMSDMGDVSRILGMNVTRDRGKGTITISQIDCTDDVVQRYCMKGCNLTYNPGVGPGLSLNQPEEKLLNEEEKRRYQSITGAGMYLAQVTRYDILYAVNQLARAMSKPAKAHMGRPSNCFATWPGPQNSSSPTSRAASGLLSFRMLTGQ